MTQTISGSTSMFKTATTNPSIGYFLYVRKSSESEDRQIQSIDDQVEWGKRRAAELGLRIVAVLPPEERSAKRPNSRPVFADMLARLQRGEASGILAWHV